MLGTLDTPGKSTPSRTHFILCRTNTVSMQNRVSCIRELPQSGTLAGGTGWAKVKAGLLSALLTSRALRTVELFSKGFMALSSTLDASGGRLYLLKTSKVSSREVMTLGRCDSAC